MFFLFEARPFIVEFFTFGDRNFDLCDPFFIKIDGKGDDDQAFFQDLAADFFDFPLVEKEFAGAPLLVIMDIAEVIRSDAGIHQTDLGASNVDEGVLERPAVVAERFDLGAKQSDPSLESFEDLIVVACAPVGNQFWGRGL